MGKAGFTSFLIFLLSAWILTAAAGEEATKLEGAKTGFRGYFAIELEGKASYYLFAITTEIYQASMRLDGRDLRICDADGNLVPYAFGGNIETAEEAKEPSLRPVPWFPLPRAEGDKKVQDGFIIAADGTLRSRERQAEPEHRGGDIVDLSRLSDDSGKTRLNALIIRIGVPADGPADYLGAVEVRASDDLQNWIPVTTAQLLRLDHDGQRLEQERIDFDNILPAKPPRYLQLRWRGAPPLIAGIEAELLTPLDGQAQSMRQRESRYWREKLPGRTQPDGTLFFDTGGVFPTDRLRFYLPRLNTVMPVKLYSRASEDAPWRFIRAETLYRLQGPDGGEQETPEIRISPNRDRFWKMTAANDRAASPKESTRQRKHFRKMDEAKDSRHDRAGNGTEEGGSAEKLDFGGIPLLSVAWQPETVTFLARGTQPFLLAAGNAQASDASIPLTRLLAGDKPYLATARLGAAQPPPANALTVATQPPEGQDLPSEERTRRFILWSVLLATVALLAFMAWKVARHLPREGAGEEDEHR